MKSYPLKLIPVTKKILWGGNYISENFGIGQEKESIAEAWMMTVRPDGVNVVDNGEYKGTTLGEYIEIAGLTNVCGNYDAFPLLIKLIDANDRLSVQVHPDDLYARKNGLDAGKTEMWYVVDCDEGARLIYGFSEDISKEEFESRIKDNTLTEVCNFVPVNKGDVFFISAGTLHAIGEGILIAEVQQNSNTTYRVSDYGRLGADGKPRELHIEKALDVTECKKPTIAYGRVGEITKIGNNTQRELASCDLFKASVLELCDSLEICEKETFVSLVVLDGELTVKWAENEIKAKKGDSIFVPANFKVNLIGGAKILCSKV